MIPVHGTSEIDTPISVTFDISDEDVRQSIDFEQIQELMNSFYALTKIGMALTDLKGNVLVATGWQDICTKFHRVHPQTLANCIESDIYLSQGLDNESYKIYKCKNNMWDIATPITVEGVHFANLFLGQFLFDDEAPDFETFSRQAKAYGFDQEVYLAALERIPRWSRETVRNMMEFYSHFARMIAELSYRNIRLAKALAERKRAEEALRESEVRYRTLFEGANDAIAIIRNGSHISCNSKTLQMYGCTMEEFIGSRPETFSPAMQPDGSDSADNAGEKIAAALSGTPQFFEWRHNRLDGTLLDVEVSLSRMKCLGSTELFTIIRDITERKRVETALRESEEKFAKSFRANPAILTISTLVEGRYVEVNEAFERFTGFRREEVIGRTSLELNIWENPEVRAGFLKTLQEEGRVREREVRFRCKGGEIIVAIVSAEIIEINGEALLLLLVNDITARMRAERALLESEQLLESEKRFRSLFEHMLEGVAYCRMLYDENGSPEDFVFLDVNSAYGELTGLHDVVGRKVSDVLPGVRESSPELFEAYGRVAATGHPEKFEIYIKQLALWRSMSVFSTEKGYFVAVSENITGRKRIEDELKEAHHKQQELAAHLTVSREMKRKAFARKVHDELGTSLTLLKFDLAWLKRNHPSDDTAVAERIISMEQLIHESTMTIQRLTAELRPSLLDEQGLAAAIEWQTAEFEKRSGISCTSAIDPAIPSLGQDTSINVYRIFQEALANVMRHAGATSVEVSLTMVGGHLLLRISDNGSGIRKEEITAHTSFGILGMEERARLCGGIIVIKGSREAGTTVSLAIPV